MNLKNLKLGAALATAGILLGVLTFSTVDKFSVETKNVLTSPFKSAEATVYKQFLDLSLNGYKDLNTSFKSHGPTNCYLENNVINCSIDTLAFNYIDSNQKNNSLTIDKVVIKNIKDFKTKVELLTDSTDKQLLIKPDYKSSFEVLSSNIKINGKTQLETVIDSLKEQSKDKSYSEEDLNMLTQLLTKHFKQIDIKLKDNSTFTNNILNSNTELSLVTDTMELGTEINVDLTKKFIELISKSQEDFNKLSNEEKSNLSIQKMNELFINNISLKLINKDKQFIKELLETTLKIESNEKLTEAAMRDQLDLNFAELLTIVNNSSLSEEFKQLFRLKVIEVSEGRTSDIILNLNNTTKQNLNNTMSLFMKANMLKDLSILNSNFALTIK